MFFIFLVSGVITAQPAKPAEILVDFSAFNDWIERGISLSDEEAGVALTLDSNFSNNLYLGTDIFLHGTGEDFNRQGAAIFYTGYFQKIDQQSSISAQLSHTVFEADFFRSWDMTELSFLYQANQDLDFQLAYSDGYFPLQRESYFVAVNWSPKITTNLSADLSAGFTYLAGYGALNNIDNYKAGINFTQQRWNFALSYHYSDQEAALIHGSDNVGNRLELIIGYQIF